MATLNNICDVTVVSATAGSETIKSIVSVTLTASANGVPSAAIVVDASDPGGDSPGSVYAASAEPAVAAYNKYIGVRNSGGEVSLEMSVKFVVGDLDTQTLRISGWPLTDVVLSPLSVGACPSLTLTCKHPLCKADSCGAMALDPKAEPKADDVSGENAVDVFVSWVRAYTEAARPSASDVSALSSGGATLKQICEKVTERADTAATALDEHLDTSGIPGFPASSAFTDGDFFKYAFKPYASGTSSAMRSLLSYVIPEASLVLGGDYTQSRLSVSPFTPWDDSDYDVLETDVVSLQLPSSDLAPLLGVHIPAYTPRNNGSFGYFVDEDSAGLKTMPIYYVPQSRLSESNPLRFGAIQTFSMPTWLASAYDALLTASAAGSSDAESAPKDNVDTGTGYMGDGINTSGGGGARAPQDELGKASLMVAQAYYETSLMSGMTMQASLRFMTSSDESVIAPGRVMAIYSADTSDGMSASKGSELLRGYITSVTHSIDVRSAKAETSIAMAYPVFCKKLPDEIKDGSRNALY